MLTYWWKQTKREMDDAREGRGHSSAVSLSGQQKVGPSARLEGMILDRSRARSSPTARRQVECVLQRKEGGPHTSVFN